MRRKNTVDINLLRLLAAKKNHTQKNKLYERYQEAITFHLEQLNIIEQLKRITQETDMELQELECEILSNMLAYYHGPMTEDYLQHFYHICPPSCVWKLATEAKFKFIKNSAAIQLEQILDQYDNEEWYQKDHPWKTKRKRKEEYK